MLDKKPNKNADWIFFLLIPSRQAQSTWRKKFFFEFFSLFAPFDNDSRLTWCEKHKFVRFTIRQLLWRSTQVQMGQEHDEESSYNVEWVSEKERLLKLYFFHLPHSGSWNQCDWVIDFMFYVIFLASLSYLLLFFYIFISLLLFRNKHNKSLSQSRMT